MSKLIEFESPFQATHEKETADKMCAEVDAEIMSEEYKEYLALLDEGYRECDAAVRSGWKGAEEI
jgi:hypothetical protein